ncbi:MAG: DUF6065 family protein [Pseudomonadota bacterium]
MQRQDFRIEVIGLVPRFHRPTPASPRTRDSVPSGYGTREQCRPFVAAAALGVTIPSPFRWGYCTADAVPAGCRKFRSPIEGGCPDRLFYVEDDAKYGFHRNQFTISDIVRSGAGDVVIPGLSFFNREDQQHFVKLHLPYIFRTDEDVGLFFDAPVNRDNENGLTPLSGLVETAWYSDAVNLVLQLPPMPGAVHIAAGDPIAQAYPMPMAIVRTSLDFPEHHRRVVRDTFSDMAAWRAKIKADRSAYKKIAKAQSGKAGAED